MLRRSSDWRNSYKSLLFTRNVYKGTLTHTHPFAPIHTRIHTHSRAFTHSHTFTQTNSCNSALTSLRRPSDIKLANEQWGNGARCRYLSLSFSINSESKYFAYTDSEKETNQPTQIIRITTLTQTNTHIIHNNNNVPLKRGTASFSPSLPPPSPSPSPSPPTHGCGGGAGPPLPSSASLRRLGIGCAGMFFDIHHIAHTLHHIRDGVGGVGTAHSPLPSAAHPCIGWCRSTYWTSNSI
jgi:hypothetical protein